MLYDLIQTWKGKETVVMTDALPKVNSRAKILRQSHRRGLKNKPVSYDIRVTTSVAKFQKKPHNYNPSGATQIARVPRKK
jgi:hypothetical protein